MSLNDVQEKYLEQIQLFHEIARLAGYGEVICYEDMARQRGVEPKYIEQVRIRYSTGHTSYAAIGEMNNHLIVIKSYARPQQDLVQLISDDVENFPAVYANWGSALGIVGKLHGIWERTMLGSLGLGRRTAYNKVAIDHLTKEAKLLRVSLGK